MNTKLLSRSQVLEALHISTSKLKELEAKGIIVGARGYGREKVYMAGDVIKLEEEICQKIQATKDALSKI